MAYCRRNAIEVYLNEPRCTNKIFDVLGRGGDAHLHLADAKSQIRYLADSQTLV